MLHEDAGSQVRQGEGVGEVADGRRTGGALGSCRDRGDPPMEIHGSRWLDVAEEHGRSAADPDAAPRDLGRRDGRDRRHRGDEVQGGVFRVDVRVDELAGHPAEVGHAVDVVVGGVDERIAQDALADERVHGVRARCGQPAPGSVRAARVHPVGRGPDIGIDGDLPQGVGRADELVEVEFAGEGADPLQAHLPARFREAGLAANLVDGIAARRRDQDDLVGTWGNGRPHLDAAAINGDRTGRSEQDVDCLVDRSHFYGITT